MSHSSFRRLAALTRDVARSNLTDPRVPFKLTLILTYRCQLRCNMCSIWKRHPEGELTPQELRRFFRTNPGFSWINVSGGEIFLRSDLREALEAVVDESRNLYLLDFPTHGQQTDRIERTVSWLVTTRVPRILVTVSMDGPPELHDRIRGVPGAWEKAIETFSVLRRIRRTGFRPFLGMTLQKENVDAFEQMLEAARTRIPDLRARDIHVNLAHESSHYYGNEGLPPLDPAIAMQALERIRKIRGAAAHPIAWLERRYQSLATKWLEAGRTPLPCRAASSSIFVDSFGIVRPCSIWDRPLGSLRDHDFDLQRLLAAAHVEDVRRDARRGRCPQCWSPCEAFPTILAHILPKPREAARIEAPMRAGAGSGGRATTGAT